LIAAGLILLTKSSVDLRDFTPDGLAERILALLPSDGTPVLNRVMQVLLSRASEARIEPKLYFQACDQLVQNGKIGRLRGQSGQIFLAIQKAVGTDYQAVEAWSEGRLMRPFHAYLEGVFRAGLYLPKEGLCIVRDTSAIGPATGRWARPDFVLISAMRYKLLPGAQVDVHSFELKTEKGASVLAVHEALAQTRFTHFGHLAWHLPDQSRMETHLPEIEDQCNSHGIGLIRIREPFDAEGYEILVDPIRKATSPTIIEGFLESRLRSDQKEALAHMLRGGR
jgi:hypothetical protein